MQMGRRRSKVAWQKGWVDIKEPCNQKCWRNNEKSKYVTLVKKIIEEKRLSGEDDGD